jgi:hypothetical protein
MTTELDSLVARISPAHTRGLHAYQPGKPVEELERELGISGAIKVASNENPLGPSPKAIAAIPAALSQLHLYPDAGGWALRRALSARLGLDPAQIVLGAGSNELLYQMVIAFCDPDDEVLSHEYGFLSYKLAAHVSGHTFVQARASAALGCDPATLAAAITPPSRATPPTSAADRSPPLTSVIVVAWAVPTRYDASTIASAWASAGVPIAPRNGSCAAASEAAGSASRSWASPPTVALPRRRARSSSTTTSAPAGSRASSASPPVAARSGTCRIGAIAPPDDEDDACPPQAATSAIAATALTPRGPRREPR